MSAGESGGASPSPSRETMDRLRRIFIEALHLNISERDLPYETPLDEAAGLDSIALLEFVTAVEAEFGVAIEPQCLELEFIRDLRRLASYLEERIRRPADR
jgi:acyl carrier protein